MRGAGRAHVCAQALTAVDGPPPGVLDVVVHPLHVADGQVVEAVAVAGRATVVELEGADATCGQQLRHRIEAGIIARVGTAVDVQREGRQLIALPGGAGEVRRERLAVAGRDGDGGHGGEGKAAERGACAEQLPRHHPTRTPPTCPCGRPCSRPCPGWGE